MGTMSDEIFICSRASFDVVRRSLPPSWRLSHAPARLATSLAFRFPDPWSHLAAVRHTIQHSIRLRTRSGSLSHAGWNRFIISTVDLMMAAKLEALPGRGEARRLTLLNVRHWSCEG